MRARRFELRVIAIALVVAWTVAAGLVLLAYRPGGPLDVVVGVTMLAPIAIAVAGVIWPPVARGSRAFQLMVSLGFGSLLMLLPSIGGVLNQLLALGSQTLLPSAEAAYPWTLALLGTSLLTGFGLARRIHGGDALRRHRVLLGIAIAIVLTTAAGALFAGVAVANELALAGSARPIGSSRYGPTDATQMPPSCDGPLAVGPAARVTMHLDADVDLRPIGTVDVTGVRSGIDFRWLAYVATNRQLGSYGAARIGQRAWSRAPGQGWVATPATDVATESVDLQALEAALVPGYRATAEDRGIEVIEGARARRCRVAVDGATFRSAFPEVRWLVGDADLGHWRGQLDYWVFLDGQLGLVAGSVNGEASGLEPGAVQATVDVRLTATERGRGPLIDPPTP